MIDLLLQARFGRGEQGNALLIGGWDRPEAAFAWSIAPESRVRLPAMPADGQVFLELTLAPFIHPPALPCQRLELWIDGLHLESRSLVWETVLRLKVPEEARRAGKPMTLVLRHPDLASPQELGAGADTRSLGFRISALTALHMAARTTPPAPAGPGRARSFRFGVNEDTGAMLREGFGDPESDYVWAVGRHSTLAVPPGPAAMLLLDLAPYIDPPHAVLQRVAVGLDGQLLGFVALRERTVVAFALPPASSGVDRVLSFDNIDAAAGPGEGHSWQGQALAFMVCGLRLIEGGMAAAAPAGSDARLGGVLEDGSLRAQVEAMTGQDAATLAARFESLGSACELGLLQRRLGTEPNGLLRFSGITTPSLIEGLLGAFWGLGRPDTLVLHRRDDPGCGYWALDTATTLGFQTPLSSLVVPEEQVKRQLSRALPFLVRKFCEDAIAAEKIFVFQRRDRTTREEAEAVLAALSIWGDATLLWVSLDDARAGTVERLSTRLLHGFVEAIGEEAGGKAGEAMGDDQRADASWLSMVAHAWRLRAA